MSWSRCTFKVKLNNLTTEGRKLTSLGILDQNLILSLRVTFEYRWCINSLKVFQIIRVLVFFAFSVGDETRYFIFIGTGMDFRKKRLFGIMTVVLM